MRLRKKMHTPCPSIDHTTTHWSSWRNSGTSIRTHLQFLTKRTCNSSWIHWQFFWKWVHSTFQVSSWCLDPICQEKGWIPLNVCWLSWVESIHCKKSVPFALNHKFMGLV
jgi:hypothetical protein